MIFHGLEDSMSHWVIISVEIERLKVIHDIMKLDLIVPLLSLLYIDIDFSI